MADPGGAYVAALDAGLLFPPEPNYCQEWQDRPLFALDADVTVYWPDVRPCYDAPASPEAGESRG